MKTARQQDSDFVLQVTRDRSVLQTVRLGSGTFLIGRSKGDLVLDDPEVSSTHCQIQLINQEYHLFDLNSTNGTFINGRRVLKSRLNVGDKIRLGRFEVEFTRSEKPKITKEPVSVAKLFKPPAQLEDRPAREILKLIEDAKASCAQQTSLILDVTWNDKTREKIEVKETRCVLGRVTVMGRFEDDSELSRKHVNVQVNGDGRVVVEDMGSTNGTYVNDEKIFAARVVSGTDVVRIGNTRMFISVKAG